MYDFYLSNGKNLIDYKPKQIHYTRALERLLESMSKYTAPYDSMSDTKEKHEDDFTKLLFLAINYCKRLDYNKLDDDEIEKEFQILQMIDEMVGAMTPREFMRMFPIVKEYDGAKYEWKDYFYCMNYINEFGIDNKIGDKAPDFLMEYQNWDIDLYMVHWMGVVNRIGMLHGGKDIFLEFMKEQGVKPRTLHSDGEYMVDDETGEKFKIIKPKNEMKKLFSV